MLGFPPRRSRETDPPLRMRRENRGSFGCVETQGVPLECRRGCRGTSSVALRVSRTLSGLRTECAISLEMLQSERASARVEGRISWLFSSCGNVPLELQRGPQGPAHGASGRSVSTQVVRGPSVLLCIRCRGQGPHLELRLEPQVSFPELTWISGFLWGFHRGVRLPLVCSHGSPLSSRARNVVSGFLSGGP